MYVFKKARIRVIRITSKEIAAARGVTPTAVNRAHCRGDVDLRDLKSIARYVLRIREANENGKSK